MRRLRRRDLHALEPTRTGLRRSGPKPGGGLRGGWPIRIARPPVRMRGGQSHDAQLRLGGCGRGCLRRQSGRHGARRAVCSPSVARDQGRQCQAGRQTAVIPRQCHNESRSEEREESQDVELHVRVSAAEASGQGALQGRLSWRGLQRVRSLSPPGCEPWLRSLEPARIVKLFVQRGTKPCVLPSLVERQAICR